MASARRSIRQAIRFLEYRIFNHYKTLTHFGNVRAHGFP
jgi:hypothetical protein